MDTKTRKDEALALLVLETMTDKQRWQLDILTLQQVGWSIKKTRSGYYAAYNPAGEIDMGMDIFMSETEGWVWVRKVQPFCTSVDACLTLPVPGWIWELHIPGMVIIREADNYYDTAITVVNKPLPLAMLKAWWSIQP